MSLAITAAVLAADPWLALILLALLVAFALIAAAVLRLMRATEDEEFVARLDRLGPDDDVELFVRILAAWRDESRA